MSDKKEFLMLSDAIEIGWIFARDCYFNQGRPYKIAIHLYDQRLLKSQMYGPTMFGPWFDYNGKEVSENGIA